MKKTAISILFVLILSAVGSAQANYSYSAQKKFIHKELGKVFLGMRFRDFVNETPVSKAVVNSIRFDWLELTVPINGKSVSSVRVRVHGLSQQEKAGMIMSESSSDAGDDEVDRLVVSKIPEHGFVYSMYVTFNDEFDLRKYALKAFGPGEDRKADDPYHFFDTQWTKKTDDGLDWLIRSFHLDEKRELQLLGRIPETEWDAS